MLKVVVFRFGKTGKTGKSFKKEKRVRTLFWDREYLMCKKGLYSRRFFKRDIISFLLKDLVLKHDVLTLLSLLFTDHIRPNLSDGPTWFYCFFYIIYFIQIRRLFKKTEKYWVTKTNFSIKSLFFTIERPEKSGQIGYLRTFYSIRVCLSVCP